MDFFVRNTSYYAYTNFLNDRANLSYKNRDKMCQLAYSFRFNRLILLQVFLMTVLSFATLATLWLIFKSAEMRRIYSLVGMDLKLLLWSGLIVYAVGSLNAFLLYAYKLIILIIDFSPCFYIWDGAECYWIQKVFFSLCVRGYLILHAGLLVERFLVASLGNYQSCNGFLGAGFMVSILIISPFSQSYATNPAYYDFERVYCCSSNTVTDTQFIWTTAYYLAANFSITIGDFFLFVFSKRQNRKYKNFRLRQRSTFNLERTFMLRQMELSINVIYPFALVNSLTFGLQMMVYIWYSLNLELMSIVGGMVTNEFVNFGRIFGNFVLIAFLWWHNRMRSRQSNKIKAAWSNTKGAADDHFQVFKTIIS